MSPGALGNSSLPLMGLTYPTTKHYKRWVPLLQSSTARPTAAPQIKQLIPIFVMVMPLPSLATAVCSSFEEAFYFYFKRVQPSFSIN